MIQSFTFLTIAQIAALLQPILGPDVELWGDELVARNPRRGDKSLGSFRFNARSHVWADFAVPGVKGQGLPSFLAYVMAISEIEASELLVRWLSEEASLGPSAPPTQPQPLAAAVSQALMPVPSDVELLGAPDFIGTHSMEFFYRNHLGELLFIVRRYDDPDNKKKIITWTYQIHTASAGTPHDPSTPTLGTWKPIKPQKPWSLYGLDRLAERQEARVLLVEGEKAADAAERLLDGVGVTVLNGASSVAHADLSPLFGRDVTLIPDNDAPGRQYALDLIHGLVGKAKSLTIVDVWSLGWEPGQDVADFEVLPDGFLDQAVEVRDWLSPDEAKALACHESEVEREAKIRELAQLDDLGYDAARKAAAKGLGIRVNSLDQAVDAKRKELRPPERDRRRKQPQALEEVAPWHAPVDGHDLAQEIFNRVTRHCVLPDGAAVVCTLFILHTYCVEDAAFTPYLILTSAIKRSGKTTLLDLLAHLVSKPVRAVNISPASLYRLIDSHQCTLLLDEVDSFLFGNEDLRGLLNAGFDQEGFAVRCEGDGKDMRVVFFSTFGAKVLAGIGKLPATVMDRGIEIRMQRKTARDHVERFRQAQKNECLILRRKITRWILDHRATIAATEPHELECLNDRAADAWYALFQIAAVLGGEWQQRAYQAARILSCRAEERDEGDLALLVLEDTRAVTSGMGFRKVTSAWLCHALAELEGQPWATYTHRAPISQVDLGKLLKPFDIIPRQIRLDPATASRPEQRGANYRGYHLADFADAWERYLPPLPTALPSQDPTAVSTQTAPEEEPEPDDDPPTPGSPRPPQSAEAVEADTTGAAPGPMDRTSELSNEGEAPADLAIVHPLTQASIPVLYLADGEEAKAAVEAMAAKQVVLGADTETTGLNPRTDQLRLFQVTDGETVLVLDLQQLSAPPKDLLAPLAQAPVVFHHAPFDLGFLRANGVDLHTVSCTQLQAAALLYRPGGVLKDRHHLSLASLSKAYLDVTVDKTAQVSDWSGSLLSKEQVLYAAMDALLVRLLWERLDTELQASKEDEGFAMVRETLQAVVAAEERGILIDRQAQAELVNQLTPRKDALLKELRAVIGPDLNPQSSPQLAHHLASTLSPELMEAWPRTPEGQLSLRRDALESFSEVPLAKPLLAYRAVADVLKTWGESYPRFIDPDGRIHPKFHLLGARSGRMSCTKPNLQNLPREPALRRCFVAPAGYQLVTADFSQVELRIAGLLSADPVIRAAYASGQDLHREIVARVTGQSAPDVTAEERKLGKALNFGLLYGAGAETFRKRAALDYDLDLTLAEAQTFKRVFDLTYKVLRAWQEQMHRTIQAQGWFMTPMGRRVYVENPTDCYTVARNYPIQGAAADLMMLAIQRTHQALLTANAPAHLVNFVHDELVLEVREDSISAVKDLVEQSMTEAFKFLFRNHDPEPFTPGLVEIGVGPNYAAAK